MEFHTLSAGDEYAKPDVEHVVLTIRDRGIEQSCKGG